MQGPRSQTPQTQNFCGRGNNGIGANATIPWKRLQRWLARCIPSTHPASQVSNRALRGNIHNFSIARIGLEAKILAKIMVFINTEYSRLKFTIRVNSKQGSSTYLAIFGVDEHHFSLRMATFNEKR